VVATEPTQYLAALIGWRNAFVVFAGLILLAALFILAAAPRKDTVGEPAPLGRQFAEMLAILKTPLFWRLAPLLGLTAGVQIGVQTLWAGPWLRDVMGLTREEVGRHLLLMAIAFMVGIFSVGLIADRLGRRGIGPIHVMLGFNLLYLAAQLVIVLRIEGLMFPAWLAVAAFGQVAILAFPWFAARIGRELAGRANASINFTMFVVAFAAQYLVGLIIGLFPATATGYSPEGYSWALGMFLVAQVLALLWYLAASPHKDAS
jgi:predicted MFS family arabinose efflux permease